MKSFIVLVLLMFSSFAMANDKNIISLNVGTADYYESGSKSYLIPNTGETGTINWNDNKIHAGIVALSYQREVLDGVYCGFIVGSDIRMFQLGFSF